MQRAWPWKTNREGRLLMAQKDERYMANWEALSRAKASEAKARLAAASRPPIPSEALNEAARKLVDARMIGAGVQARTLSDRDVVVVNTDHHAIVVGRDGAEKVADEGSATRALFDRSSCAVFRLHADGMIDHPGVMASLAFAAAGDVILGGQRVRTVDFEKVRGTDGEQLNEAERVKIARWRWDIARIRLLAAQFRILNGVMRHDETATAAARAAYPRYSCRKKLSGMGDQALIDACGSLAQEYGFEVKKPSHRSLAGLGVEQ